MPIGVFFLFMDDMKTVGGMKFGKREDYRKIPNIPNLSPTDNTPPAPRFELETIIALAHALAD